ncbi:Thoeris anti-defense Tad2 family protein [Xenorhabdus stockiae]|uniref:Thoeris anti-defense Tad2 family protein n=1 Tax=Xenorhabdus stockiae TaxID=351614 RepID=UPI0040629533
MSDVNKPEKYKFEDDNVIVKAGPGSFAWAINLIFEGLKVYRAGWSIPKEYMSLSPDTGVEPYIIKTDKDGIEYPWKPSMEELKEYLIASDWKTACMLSFDLEIGTTVYPGGYPQPSQDWGFSAVSGSELMPGEANIGVLTNLYSTIGIGSADIFRYSEGPIGALGSLTLSVDNQNQPNLWSKMLEVTVNGSTYNVGTTVSSQYYFQYDSDGAQKLGDFLKQNVGNTLFFCFNWK